jgi:hypothetical protein
MECCESGGGAVELSIRAPRIAGQPQCQRPRDTQRGAHILGERDAELIDHSERLGNYTCTPAMQCLGDGVHAAGQVAFMVRLANDAHLNGAAASPVERQPVAQHATIVGLVPQRLGVRTNQSTL